MASASFRPTPAAPSPDGPAFENNPYTDLIETDGGGLDGFGIGDGAGGANYLGYARAKRKLSVVPLMSWFAASAVPRRDGLSEV
jgi:hypothetical protein